VAVGLVLDYTETRDTHTLTLTLETADNKPVFSPVEIRFSTGSPPGLPPGDSGRFTAVIQGPFPLQREGAHQWVVAVDGERFAPRHFRVVRLTPLVPQPPPSSG
jgi:hypothetical protein